MYIYRSNYVLMKENSLHELIVLSVVDMLDPYQKLNQ